MKVLVVVAHADDEVLGVGGTVARHSESDDVEVVIAADCRTARDPSLMPELSEEAIASVKVLGADVTFLGFRAMTLGTSELDVNKVVGSIIADRAPDIVYTHHLLDINSDHRAVANAVLVGTRPVNPKHTIKRVLSFETPSSSEWGGPFQPNVFVDIELTLEQKLEALRCYKSEMRDPPHPRSLDMLRARAQFWGQISGLRYAESFMLVREVCRAQ